MTSNPTADVPVITLNPYGEDHHGEAAAMRAAGPVVRLRLPGDVYAWSVTEHKLLLALLSDQRISKNWHNWTALQTGEVTDDWPLIGMIKVNNMSYADGQDHMRLRRLVSSAFTLRRVENLRPRLERLVTDLLDALPAHTEPDGSVDLRTHYAHQVPLGMICELVGLPEQWRPQLRYLVDTLLRTDTTTDEAVEFERGRLELLNALVELRRDEPGDDFTSALIAKSREDADAVTQEELVDTLWALLAAGHETTLSLITNGARALLTHPAQLEIARSEGPDIWSAVVEETLRWDAPVGNFPARWPTEDIEIEGVTIPQGEMILAPYSGVGRDPAYHGENADRFDITRPPTKHLAFGSGPHVCAGTHLARMEGTVALPRLFERYPELSLAVDPGDLQPVPSFFSNSVRKLPVRLHHDG